MIEQLAEYLVPIATSNTAVATLLALAAVLVGRLRSCPTLAHCLWVLVLIKMVTPPLVQIDVPMPSHSTPVATVPTQRDATTSVVDPATSDDELLASARRLLTEAEDASGAAILGPPSMDVANTVAWTAGFDRVHWGALGLWIWVIGAAFALAMALYRALAFQRQLRHAHPASAELQAEVVELGRKLGLRRIPSVAVLPGRLSPMLWSFFGQPRVLLPESLTANLSADQRRTLLVHELAHYHRKDHWVRLLEMFVRAVYWFHPLVWWASRELRAVEEECCDAWVVWALPDASRSYADALVDTVEFLSDAKNELPAPASGIGKVTNLKRRLMMIMQGDSHRSLGHLGRATVFALAAITLPLVPAFGQKRGHEHRAEEARRADEVDVLRAKMDAERARRIQKQMVHQNHQTADNENVMRALRRAVKLLRKSDHGTYARALSALLGRLQGPQHTHERHQDAQHTHDQHVHDLDLKMHEASRDYTRALKERRTADAKRLKAVMESLSKNANTIHHEFQVARGQFRNAQREMTTLERLIHDPHLPDAFNKLLANRPDRVPGQEQRIRGLEQQVKELTGLVRKLLRDRGGREKNRHRGRRGEREVDEMDVEEEEEIEEEIEEEEIEEEEIKESATKKQRHENKGKAHGKHKRKDR